MRGQDARAFDMPMSPYGERRADEKKCQQSLAQADLAGEANTAGKSVNRINCSVQIRHAV
ncbi:hypothetical protein PT2222_20427 [Paraburkholderia tropica]